MGEDKKILKFLIIVAIIVVVIELPSVVRGISKLSPEYAQLKDSNFMKSLEEYEKVENTIWQKIKGTTIKQSSIFASAEEKVKGAKTDMIATSTIGVQEPEKITPPLKFLTIGDSMMLVGFGPALENMLISYNVVGVMRDGMYSTGLNRIDYFDWYSYTDQLINQYNPDVIVVMFGANDGQGILDTDGTAYNLYTPEWERVYHDRVNRYLALFSDRVKIIYWVGHPITDSPDFQPKFLVMNSIYQSECAKYDNVVYIDTWDVFAQDGQPLSVVADSSGLSQIVKQSDGVHVTDHGGKILAEFVFNKMKEQIDFDAKPYVFVPTDGSTSTSEVVE